MVKTDIELYILFDVKSYIHAYPSRLFKNIKHNEHALNAPKINYILIETYLISHLI